MAKKISTFLFALLVLGAWSSPQAAGPAGNGPSGEKYEWRKCASADGINIYWCRVPGNPVVAFRGEGIVDAPLEKVASVVADTSRGREWVDHLVEARVVRSISLSDFVEYDHMGVPFPFTAVVSDRDFVSHVRLESDPKNGRMTVSYKSVEDPLAPVSRKYVRGNLIKCVFKMTPMTLPGQTYVEAEFHCDPQGSLSKWMANFFQEKWPMTTFKNLRKQAGKSDIRVLPVVQGLIHGSPVYAEAESSSND